MYFFSINTINSIKAYRDTEDGTNYIEIKFKDLDNINHTLIYGKKNQYPDTENGETMNEFTSEFISTLNLCYDLFDYDDIRNELFKILYRYNLDFNRRSYFRSTLIDGNFSAYLTTELGRFEDFRWLDTTNNNVTRIRTTDDPYLGFDDDGNEVTLDSTKVILLAYYKFDFPDMIFDNTRQFLTATVDFTDQKQFNDFNAIIKTPQVYVLLTDITSDIIDTLISKTSLHEDQVTNIIIDIPVSNLSDEIRSKIRSELSSLNNIRIFAMIDSEDMSKDVETVINEIDEIYSIFGNYIDGIYLKNIKTLDIENATAEERENYYQYYMNIKLHAHNSINTEDGAALRYYVIGRMTDGNVVPTYMYSKYNNPADQVISYIGDTPLETTQLGDSLYQNFKIAEITNKDLTELTDDDKKAYMDNITKYCSGFYITDQDNFDMLSNSLEDQQKYCEAFVDEYKSFYFTQI